MDCYLGGLPPVCKGRMGWQNTAQEWPEGPGLPPSFTSHMHWDARSHGRLYAQQENAEERFHSLYPQPTTSGHYENHMSQYWWTLFAGRGNDSFSLGNQVYQELESFCKRNFPCWFQFLWKRSIHSCDQRPGWSMGGFSFSGIADQQSVCCFWKFHFRRRSWWDFILTSANHIHRENVTHSSNCGKFSWILFRE